LEADKFFIASIQHLHVYFRLDTLRSRFTVRIELSKRGERDLNLFIALLMITGITIFFNNMYQNFIDESRLAYSPLILNYLILCLVSIFLGWKTRKKTKKQLK